MHSMGCKQTTNILELTNDRVHLLPLHSRRTCMAILVCTLLCPSKACGCLWEDNIGTP